MLAYDSPLAYDGPGAYASSVSARPWLQLDDGEDRVVFNTGAAGDGVEWVVSDLTGWDSAEVRAPAARRPADHGLFLSTFFHGGRVLELVGHVMAPTTALAYAAKTALARLTNIDRPLTLTVYEDRSRIVTARRSDRLLLRQVDGYVEFSIPLLAADPRKYAAELFELTADVGVDVVADNEGTMSTRASVTVTGPIATPLLRNVTSGEELAVDVALDAGETLIVDFDLHAVSVGGVSRRSAVLSGYRWWELAPGTNTLRLEADTSEAGASMALQWRSAWI